MRISASIRRNSGDVCDLTDLRALARALADTFAKSSSHCATSIGEYFALGRPARSSSEHSTTVEKIWGSSGLTVPKHFGVGVSPYGEGSLPSTIGMFV